jgi:hypothetical protein
MIERNPDPLELVDTFIAAAETHARLYADLPKGPEKVAALQDQDTVMREALGGILLLDKPTTRDCLVTIFRARDEKIRSKDPVTEHAGLNIINQMVRVRRFARQTKNAQPPH